MKLKTTALLTAVAALFLAQGTIAQAATDRKFECYDEGVMPKAKASKTRAEVKGQINGKTYSCFEESMEPTAKSSKDRAKVKAETAAAVKAGEIPRGEANMPQKK